MRAASPYVGGEWTASSWGEGIDVVSPHSEQVVGRAPAAGAVRRREGQRVRARARPRGLDEFLEVKAISVAT
jgi:hypothetical protein